MNPWELDHNDPKKIRVTATGKQAAYCATPTIARVVLHRTQTWPALLEAVRALVPLVPLHDLDHKRAALPSQIRYRRLVEEAKAAIAAAEAIAMEGE